QCRDRTPGRCPRPPPSSAWSLARGELGVDHVVIAGAPRIPGTPGAGWRAAAVLCTGAVGSGLRARARRAQGLVDLLQLGRQAAQPVQRGAVVLERLPGVGDAVLGPRPLVH